MSTPTLVAFVAYLTVILGIGTVASKRTASMDGYLLGGRSLGPVTTALSAGASDMSGWLLLGLPGAVYLSGLSEVWIAVGLTVGAFLNWTFVAGRLRAASASSGAMTLPGFLALRFGSSASRGVGPVAVLRVVSALVILLFFTFYAASGLVAGARLFEASFGLSYTLALGVGALVIVSYTALGGFLAVSWTDVLQGTIMLLALIAVPVIVWGGLPEAALAHEKATYLSPIEGVSVITAAGLLAWGLGYFGQPHILARFMAARSDSAVAKGRVIGMSWMVVTLGCAVAVGVLGNAHLHAAGTPLAATNAETVFITLTQVVFNPWVGGILLAAILSAIMSTIDSQLLVSSSVLTEDLYRPLRPAASERELVLVGRVMVLVICAIAAAIALDPESQVLGLVSYAWAGLGAAFGPVVLFSLYGRRTTHWGAIAGMVTGALTVVVWSRLTGGLFELYELLPAFVLACIAIAIVSKATQPAPP